MKGLLLIVVLLVTLSPHCWADAEKDSHQYVKESKRCLAAFRCAHFAFVAKKEELGQKLLKQGYQSGKKFLEATRSQKLTNEDLEEIAIAFRLYSYGPNDDFILGRLFQAMSSECDEILRETPPAKWEDVASDELKRGNVELLLNADEPVKEDP